MSLREGVSASRRFHLRLPSDLEAQLVAFARPHGLGLGPAIRLLVGRALEKEERQVEDSPAALAALAAAEHAVLMVASILPEGQRRRHELFEPAAKAAEARLALFRAPSTESEEERS
jgi:hypothetical protein